MWGPNRKGGEWLKDCPGFPSEGKKYRTEPLVPESHPTAYLQAKLNIKQRERGGREQFKGSFLAFSWPLLVVVNGWWVWVCRVWWRALTATVTNRPWCWEDENQENQVVLILKSKLFHWGGSLISSVNIEKLHKMLSHWLCNIILVSKGYSMSVRPNGMHVKCFVQRRSHCTKLHLCEL